MKFAKILRNEMAETLPQWRGEFLAYKLLKKQVNLIAYEERAKLENEERLSYIINEELGFMQLLGHELEKVNKFFFDKEAQCIIKMKELKEKVVMISTNLEKIQVILDVLEFHGEMVLLHHYSVINFAGLLKIIKKHNKKTGTVISLPLLPMFFTTEVISQLLRECEMMLIQLFHGDGP